MLTSCTMNLRFQHRGKIPITLQRDLSEHCVLANYLPQIWGEFDTYWTYHHSVLKFQPMYFLHSVPYFHWLLLSYTFEHSLWINNTSKNTLYRFLHTTSSTLHTSHNQEMLRFVLLWVQQFGNFSQSSNQGLHCKTLHVKIAQL